MTKYELWHSKEGFGTALLIACIDDWGIECVSWEPETLEITIREKYGDVDPDSLQRLLAAISVMTSDMFTQDVSALCLICTTLDFERGADDMFEPAGLDEIMWGLTEARMILGGIDPKKFSDEIRIYVGKLMDEEGLTKPPKTLEFALPSKGGPSPEVFADLPELSQMFEEDQEISKEDLDEAAISKLNRLLDQINSLKLATSDMSEFRAMLDRIKSENA